MSKSMWVRRLAPTESGAELRPTCLPETWMKTVAEIGAGPALWAVELSQQHARVAVQSELRGDLRAQEALQLQPSTESVNLRALVALANGSSSPATATPELARQIAWSVKRGVPLEVMLERAHESHAWFGNALIEQFHRLSPPENQTTGAAELSRFLIDHVSAFSRAFNATYIAEERAWLTSREGRIADSVRSVLRGDAVDRDPEFVRHYKIESLFHVGLTLRPSLNDSHTVTDTAEIAAGLLTGLGASAHLTIRADERDIWAWGSFSVAPSTSALEMRPAVPHLFIAIGRPGYGLDGFRRTFEDTQHALRIAAQASSSTELGGIVTFQRLRLASVLLSDPEQAAEFARNELGGLALPQEAILRDTVLVYLESQFSPTAAAKRLHIAKNTVVYRVQRAEQLLGRKVKEDHAILWAALHVAELMNLTQSDRESTRASL